MTYLNELKAGEFARIVEIENIKDLISHCASIGLLDGCFIRIISCFGNIVFKSAGKTYVISKIFAEGIRVIVLNNKFYNI